MCCLLCLLLSVGESVSIPTQTSEAMALFEAIRLLATAPRSTCRARIPFPEKRLFWDALADMFPSRWSMKWWTCCSSLNESISSSLSRSDVRVFPPPPLCPALRCLGAARLLRSRIVAVNAAGVTLDPDGDVDWAVSSRPVAEFLLFPRPERWVGISQNALSMVLWDSTGG